MTLLALHTIGCVSLFVLIGSFDSNDREDILSAAGFAALMIAPIAILLLSRRLSYVSLIVAVVFSLGGFYLYWRALFGPEVDAQAGLVLIFIPFCQLVAAVGLVALAWVAKLGAKRIEE